MKKSITLTPSASIWAFVLCFGLLLAGLTGCSSTNNAHYQPQYHLGPITPADLLARYPIFADHKQTDDNSASETEILDLANQLNNKKLVVVFGTWCHDSQREVPRLLNLLDKVVANHPQSKIDISFIAAAPYELRDKKLVKQYRLTAVPTIMLFDKDQELGRVVEHTKLTLAADIVNMKL